LFDWYCFGGGVDGVVDVDDVGVVEVL